MAVEFVNALNAAAAAESECAKLRRFLEEEGKLVQRFKQEKEDESQMAKRKIERMSQRLAEAQKDVEYATARADVAENEWVKLKRELQEARELVQLLKPESEETGQIVLRQVDDKELELANALNAASIAESECDKLRTMLEEQRKLVQRLILEKEDEAQVAKRQIQEIGQELDDARKLADDATTRADAVETEWIKAKKELQELQELFQSLKPECDERRQSAMRQVEEKERELVNALHASEITKRTLEEEQKLVQRLRREKDAEVQLAKRQIEEINRELACARRDAELARKDADAAENEWSKVNRDLKNMEENVKLLKLQCQEIRESANRKDEERALELANALNASAIVESECAKLKRMLIEEDKTVKRLTIEKDNEVELAKRQIEKMGQELAYAQKEAQYARKDADIAENEWMKVKRELKGKEELVRQVEKISQELHDARKEAEYAQNDADIAKNEWTKVKRELRGKEELVRQVEKISQELVDARKEVEHARNDADIAKNEWTKAKRELRGKEELESQGEKISQELEDARKEVEHARDDADIAKNEWTKVKRELRGKEELMRQVEKISQELEDARKEAEHARDDADIAKNEWTEVNRKLRGTEELVRQFEKISLELEDARKEVKHARDDADIAKNEWIKAKKDLQEKLEVIQFLKLECQETSERAMRQVQEKEQELAIALDAVTGASSSSVLAQDCAVCWTNEKNMAFGCGHMTCEDCGMALSACPVCRRDIKRRIKLYPG